MLQRFSEVLTTRKQKKWAAIGKQAAKARFLWSDVAKKYSSLLYED
jgi:hypothetical protein